MWYSLLMTSIIYPCVVAWTWGGGWLSSFQGTLVHIEMGCFFSDGRCAVVFVPLLIVGLCSCFVGRLCSWSLFLALLTQDLWVWIGLTLGPGKHGTHHKKGLHYCSTSFVLLKA